MKDSNLQKKNKIMTADSLPTAPNVESVANKCDEKETVTDDKKAVDESRLSDGVQKLPSPQQAADQDKVIDNGGDSSQAERENSSKRVDEEVVDFEDEDQGRWNLKFNFYKIDHILMFFFCPRIETAKIVTISIIYDFLKISIWSNISF